MKCNRCGAELENVSSFCTECGAALNLSEDATLAADFDRTVAAPINYQNANNPQPVQQYDYPQPAPVQQKKPPVLPIVVAILAVLVVVLAGAFIFKEDIVDLFEKDSSSSKSDRKDNNKKDDKEDDEYYDDYNIYETTIDQAAMDKEFEEALKNTQAPVTKVQEVVVTEVVTNAEAHTEVVTEVVTEIVTENQNGLTTGDATLIADYYNKAVSNTTSVTGQQTLVLSKNFDGDGAIGTILKVLEPAVDKALKKNSKTIYEIPGNSGGQLEASDIVNATAISKNGRTTITITLKGQVDGPDCDANTAGPVARGIGTLGSIDGALAELGAEITDGRDTVKLTYKNAYIKCVVDERTGQIISGEWFYTVDIFIGDADAKLGIKANLKNLTTAIDYKVVI